jgi:nucleotide-binding universal stress UspA family protein
MEFDAGVVNPIEEEREGMEGFPTKMLLATDGSEEAELALRTAVDLATSTNSELHVVHVFPSDIGVPYPAEVLQREPPDQSMQQAQAFLDRQAELIRAEGAAVAGSHFRMGRPANEIIKLSGELGVDLVVMGSRGLGGVRRALMGSVSDAVVRHAPCPVMIVRKSTRE